jgi:hypothetical protein
VVWCLPLILCHHRYGSHDPCPGAARTQEKHTYRFLSQTAETICDGFPAKTPVVSDYSSAEFAESAVQSAERFTTNQLSTFERSALRS